MMIVIGVPNSVPRAGDLVKGVKQSPVANKNDGNAYELLLRDQKKDLVETLEWNGYAVVAAKVYGMVLAIVLLTLTVRSSSWHFMKECITGIPVKINETLQSRIGKSLKYIHIYRALASFFMV